MKVLYITYDGLTDPLGASQVLPYLSGMADAGIKFTVISFEKKEKIKNVMLCKAACLKMDLATLQYHKKPPLFSTCYDIACGIIKACTIVRKEGQKIVHARGYVAALVALFIKRIFKTKFVFDMRGFWADERSEAGLWKKDSRIYRVAKYFEKQFFLKADYIISLTNSGKEEIAKLGYLKSRPLYIEVIPTCVDLEKFKLIPANKTPGQLSKKNTLVYVGSVSTWYMLKEMIDFAIMANKAGLADKFIIVTHETDYAKKALKIGCDDFISVVSANRDEVQNYISSASIGLAFYKPGYSRKGCCPTKLGEYLACGVPVIINSGVGDSDALVMGERVGVVLDEFSESEYSRAIDIIRGLLAEGESLRLRCRAAAAKCLSLETGVKRYIDVYRSLSRR